MTSPRQRRERAHPGEGEPLPSWKAMINCHHCGKPFVTLARHLRHPSGRGRYCGPTCGRAVSNKLKWANYYARFDELFWNRVDKSGGPESCWPWTGLLHPEGYGRLRRHGKAIFTHRVAFELAHGRPVPEGLLVCHHCDNPPCCNPSHLYAGTHQDNANDKARRGRVRHGNCALRKNKLVPFRGVTKYRAGFGARISANGREIRLGRFKTAIEAAQAYDRVAKQIIGEAALLNFPDGSPLFVGRG